MNDTQNCKWSVQSTFVFITMSYEYTAMFRILFPKNNIYLQNELACR